MRTLAQIETAADARSNDEREAMLRFLAIRLRKDRALPAPRLFSGEEVAAMLAEDEADGARFRAGQ